MSLFLTFKRADSSYRDSIKETLTVKCVSSGRVVLFKASQTQQHQDNSRPLTVLWKRRLDENFRSFSSSLSLLAAVNLVV